MPTDRRRCGTTGCAHRLRKCNRFPDWCLETVAPRPFFSENQRPVPVSCLSWLRARESTSRTEARLPLPVRRSRRPAAERSPKRADSRASWKVPFLLCAAVYRSGGPQRGRLSVSPCPSLARGCSAQSSACALVTDSWGIPLIDRLAVLEDYSRVLLKRFN